MVPVSAEGGTCREFFQLEGRGGVALSSITGTVLVILFAPLFYVLIEKTFGKHRASAATRAAQPTRSGNH